MNMSAWCIEQRSSLRNSACVVVFVLSMVPSVASISQALSPEANPAGAAAIENPASTSAQSVFTISENTLALIESQYGTEGRQRITNWVAMVRKDADNPALSELQKLTHANDFFNQVRWLSDIEHWGVDDYWATPVETLGSNGGDCEDFSIGKYFSLDNVAFEQSKLRITYVKSLQYNQAHMVLSYYDTPGAEPLILDNINKTILPASKREDLIPIYSFDAKNIWLAKERGKKLRANSMDSLPQWKRVNEQMRGDKAQ